MTTRNLSLTFARMRSADLEKRKRYGTAADGAVDAVNTTQLLGYDVKPLVNEPAPSNSDGDLCAYLNAAHDGVNEKRTCNGVR